MTTIQAVCPTCGTVHVNSADITLMVCDARPALSYYEFTCPDCHDEVRKPADDHAIAILMSGGVDATAWELPPEALEPHDGPPVGSDDLLDLLLALDAVDELAPIALDDLARKDT